MVELFGASTVLFESGEGEEAVRIECAVREDGGMAVLQESDGPLTDWCFEETPHRVETVIGPLSVKGLMEYFHLESAVQVPAALRMQYVGYESARRIRELLRRLELPYEVVEELPAR